MDSAYAGSEQKLDLAKILEDIFLVLTPKEKEVIIKRFCLNNEPRQTLEKIGQQFSVTRERIRQIEKIALGKLRRTLENTKLAEVARIAKELLVAHGGVCEEDEITSEILQRLFSTSELDSNIVKLSLAISPDMIRAEKNGVMHPFWRMKHVDEEELMVISETIFHLLSKKKDVVPAIELAAEVEVTLKEKGKTIAKETAISLFSIDVRFKKVKEGIGLMSWRHINPKSIRDKAYIILKREAKPLHFVEIANKITESAFDKKVVTTQAVHNELIRDEHFVLVGRGLYGLKEWGYKKGTIGDVIESILRGSQNPLSKDEIIAEVLKQRIAKKNTIIVGLANKERFQKTPENKYILSNNA